MPNTDDAAKRSRIAGALLGVTIGDTLGAPLEFKSPEAIRAQWGIHRDIEGTGTFGHPAGVGTDDSDLTFAVARAYAHDEGASLDKVAANFIAWKDSGPRDIGGATASGIGKLRQLRSSKATDLTKAGGTGENSCGNGSLMRAVATGLAQPDPVARSTEAIDISALTHAHPRCTESCALYSDLVHALVEGDSPEGAYKSAKRSWEARKGRGERPDWMVMEALGAFQHGWDIAVSHEWLGDDGLSKLGTSGYVLDGLALATWALRRSMDVSPEQALIEVVNRGGDADTNGAIVGGVLGAAYGREAWPERWTDKLSYGQEALEVADKLAEIRANAPVDHEHPPFRPELGDSYKNGFKGVQLAARKSSGDGSLDIEDLLSGTSESSDSRSYWFRAENSEPKPSLFRRVFGLGQKKSPTQRTECGHWMPIARKRCVLSPGHPPSVHHTSVRRPSFGRPSFVDIPGRPT